jgi:hypothetical protein
MKDKPKLPPSLNRVRAAPAPDESEYSRIERANELRRTNVEAALCSLKLTAEAKSRAPSFVHLFEGTYYQVRAGEYGSPAGATRIEDDLVDMARLAIKLDNYVHGMHADTIRALTRAGLRPNTPSEFTRLALHSFLGDIIVTAKGAMAANETAKGANKKGRPIDVMAAEMRATAAFVYKKLTGKDGGRVYDAHASQEKDSVFCKFLKRIFVAYGINASARSRTRQRGRAMGKNSGK